MLCDLNGYARRCGSRVGLMLDLATLPIFKPHPLIPGGHAQTLAGVFLPARRIDYRARRHIVTLADGDQLVVHDDCPNGWQPPAARPS